jgi:DNA-binding NarL/FixJ family response regulator
MTNESVSSLSSISVLLADSKPMEGHLLAGALRHHGFRVSCCPSDSAPILELADHGVMDVAVLSCAVLQSGESDMAVLRTLHLSNPQIPKIVLMATDSRELAVQSFRLGARGLFCLADSSFQRLCECIEQVHRGEIWATTQQLNYLLDSECQVSLLRVMSANGEKLLTSRRAGRRPGRGWPEQSPRRHRTRPQRAHGQEIFISNFRKAGDFKSRGIGPLRRASWLDAAERVDRGVKQWSVVSGQ